MDLDLDQDRRGMIAIQCFYQPNDEQPKPSSNSNIRGWQKSLEKKLPLPSPRVTNVLNKRVEQTCLNTRVEQTCY